MQRPPMFVLAVDDMDDDLTLLSMAFRKSAPDVIARFAHGGEAALAYMAGEGKYADRSTYPLPRLMLLDLKMPRVNGFAVLRQVRSMRLVEQPYIIVLTSSKLTEDQQKSEAMGADFFHTKPADFNELCEMIKKIIEFFSLAPPRPAQRP